MFRIHVWYESIYHGFNWGVLNWILCMRIVYLNYKGFIYFTVIMTNTSSLLPKSLNTVQIQCNKVMQSKNRARRKKILNETCNVVCYLFFSAVFRFLDSNCRWCVMSSTLVIVTSFARLPQGTIFWSCIVLIL